MTAKTPLSLSQTNIQTEPQQRWHFKKGVWLRKGLDVAAEVQSAGQLSGCSLTELPPMRLMNIKRSGMHRQAGLTRRDPGTIFMETQAQGRKPVVSTELSLHARFPEHLEL